MTCSSRVHKVRAVLVAVAMAGVMAGLALPAQASHDTCSDEPSDVAVDQVPGVFVGVDPDGADLDGGDGLIAVCQKGVTNPSHLVYTVNEVDDAGVGTSIEVRQCNSGPGWGCDTVLLSRTGAEVDPAQPLTACVWVNGTQRNPFCSP